MEIKKRIRNKKEKKIIMKQVLKIQKMKVLQQEQQG